MHTHACMHAHAIQIESLGTFLLKEWGKSQRGDVIGFQNKILPHDTSSSSFSTIVRGRMTATQPYVRNPNAAHYSASLVRSRSSQEGSHSNAHVDESVHTQDHVLGVTR